MADKIFNTRISLKYDTLENWSTNNPVLLEGEAAVATIAVDAENPTQATPPVVLMKIGDGITAFNELPALGGRSLDVYSWAKAENKPTYAATEITGIDTYIFEYVNESMGISVDTDTQYTIVKAKNDDGSDNNYQYKLMSKSKADADYTDEVAVIDIPDDTAAIAALEQLVGETPVAQQIANSIAALDLANTYEAKGEAAKVQAALDEYIESNDAALAAEAQAARAAEQANADAIDAVEATIGTVTEGKTVVQMIEEAKNDATYDDTGLAERVTAVEGKVDTLNANAETEGSVDYKIAQAVAAIMENPDETMNSINELVTWVNEHAEDALALSNQVTTNKNDIAALDALVGDTAVSTQIQSAIAEALNVEGVDKYALASDLTAAIARIAQNETDIAGLKSRVDTAEADIDALQEDIAKKANDAELAEVSKSGLIDDLSIGEGTTLIFDCGDSNV